MSGFRGLVQGLRPNIPRGSCYAHDLGRFRLRRSKSHNDCEVSKFKLSVDREENVKHALIRHGRESIFVFVQDR